jgi:hypothetical protein
VNLPNDPLEALNWAWHHWDGAWWIIAALGIGIAWTRKRLADWSRRNSLSLGRPPAGTPVAAAPVAPPAPAPVQASAAYAAAPSYAAAGYTAQPAYAAPPPAVAAPHASSSRKLYREGAAPQRTVTPVARSVDVPAAAAGGGRWTLAGAFGDPAHARNAIIVAEIIGPPVALR